MVFILSALWWTRIKGLWKLPDGRNWGGRAMLSKSLIQFSVDGWGCVPSLLFDLRPNYVEVMKIIHHEKFWAGWSTSGIKIARRIINNLRYADGPTHQWKWKWSLSVVSNSLWPLDCSPPSSSVHMILQARILEWVAISFSKGIFLTQGSNPGLPHCSQTL